MSLAQIDDERSDDWQKNRMQYKYTAGLRRDTAGKNIVFFLLVNFEILVYFASITCFLSYQYKGSKYTLMCLFYYILYVRVGIFLGNSPNVSILTEHTVQRLLSEP